VTAEGFDFVWLVIGSGFGGSVSALRLSEKGFRVGVLEPGRRYGYLFPTLSMTWPTGWTILFQDVPKKATGQGKNTPWLASSLVELPGIEPVAGCWSLSRTGTELRNDIPCDSPELTSVDTECAQNVPTRSVD
jgi:glycine/D-amino acid oxidase-like deaminating enzyme